MSQNNGVDSITKGCDHLNIAKEYLLDFKRCCIYDVKQKASLWASKVEYVLNDIFNNLTPEAKEVYRKEILNSKDPIFMEAISFKFLQLDEAQREMMETIIDAVLRGEKIIFEDDKK